MSLRQCWNCNYLAFFNSLQGLNLNFIAYILTRIVSERLAAVFSRSLTIRKIGERGATVPPTGRYPILQRAIVHCTRLKINKINNKINNKKINRWFFRALKSLEYLFIYLILSIVHDGLANVREDQMTSGLANIQGLDVAHLFLGTSVGRGAVLQRERVAALVFHSVGQGHAQGQN